MALPKRRHSHSRTRKRRSHDFLEHVSVSKCPECDEPKLSHRVCGSCGKYHGKAVVIMEEETVS